MTPPTPTGSSMRDRRQHAGAADWMIDALSIVALSAGNLCAIAQRGRANETQPLLPIEPVDLVDDAVDVVIEVGALFLDL